MSSRESAEGQQERGAEIVSDQSPSDRLGIWEHRDSNDSRGCSAAVFPSRRDILTGQTCCSFSSALRAAGQLRLDAIGASAGATRIDIYEVGSVPVLGSLGV